MIDQLMIGDKSSFDDFEASLSKRKIGQPKKKTVKETVPYSNNTYDFSAINGELYWEERTLEYVFEIISPTPEKLEEAKAAFSDWVSGVMKEDIFDPFIPDYHFVGTFDEIDFDDEEGLDKTTATVKFTAYPYKVANIVKKYTYNIAAGATVEIAVVNNSSHRITPTFKSTTGLVIKRDNISYAVEAGEVKDDTFMLEKGVTELTLQNPYSSVCTVEISFIEEVL